ncbi:hypothetical protein TD95_004174 [Thielaviopsis punctulata]|uniref:Ubiquitin 3 binding protein But2 C-terminal domain-containing protein n=1 Tax=Thielaviopsis punctulata TaxID=72032 RepID=A0A0F4ZIM6_9PEZI|nr:hypothetical protein TD95_004174 [Thielaviopsis punctulata]
MKSSIIFIVCAAHLALAVGETLQIESNCLDRNAIQVASNTTGVTSASNSSTPSETDPYNFINYCSGRTVTNGTQNVAGSCNPIPMGRIPSTSQMISSIITFPQPQAILTENSTFSISIQTTNLALGFFSNAKTNYVSAPQDLDATGRVLGHVHVTIQSLLSLNTTTPPDASTYVFFKGINDSGNGRGLLHAQVTGGLMAGVYRVCTLMAATNHQPVIMPVALRGAQDDCIRFTVVAGREECPSPVTVTATETVTTTLSEP